MKSIAAILLLLLTLACQSSSVKEAERLAKEAAQKKIEEEARRALSGSGTLSSAALTGFAPRKAELKPAYFRSWFEHNRNSLFGTIQALPEGSVLVVTGHSDPLGGEALAESLGRQRAEYVARELLKLGVPPHKITTNSMGSRQLANPHFPGAGENRRVTFETSAGSGVAGAIRSALPGLPGALPGTQSLMPDMTALNSELEKLTVSGFTSARSSLGKGYETMWLGMLNRILPQLRAALASGYILEVAGHSDPFGGPAKADRFARQRANYVAGLLRKSGISSRSMQVVSRGAMEPANPNFAGAAENRRVTLKLMAAGRSYLPTLPGLPGSLPGVLPGGVPSGLLPQSYGTSPDYTAPGY